jgi:RecB family endonuclease NucS
VPDQDWRDAFDSKWKSSRDLWDRKLFLIHDKVRLVTTADEFVEKLDWVEKTIHETNDAIKDQYRIIGKEKEMIREAAAKQVLQMDMRGSEMIVETLRKRFSGM